MADLVNRFSSTPSVAPRDGSIIGARVTIAHASDASPGPSPQSTIMVAPQPSMVDSPERVHRTRADKTRMNLRSRRG